MLLSAGVLCAQPAAPAADLEVQRAQAGIEKLRALVEAGAAPRAMLEKAEAALADAQDAAYLRRTLYGGKDLSEEQTDEMVAAANRRLERRQKDLENAKKLVDEGVASQVSLGNFLESLDFARKEYDLALSRQNLVRELTLMAKHEAELEQKLQEQPSDAQKLAERYDGYGMFSTVDFKRVETAFQQRFAKPLPVSAMGETAVHRALGFDHRGRVDVAVNPSQPEGVWLRQFLAANHIPYFAFWHAVPGKATGAHIHIGPGSTRIVNGG